MRLRVKGAPIGLAKEYALQLGKTENVFTPGSVNLPCCFLVPPNLFPLHLRLYISHTVIITEITFLIQSIKHLLSTVTKLISSW